MSGEFIEIMLGVVAFLTSIFVISFQLIKGSPAKAKHSDDENCNHVLSPWYLACLKSAVVFGVTIPIAYPLLGMCISRGRLEIFTLVLGFIVAVPIGVTYGFLNLFIIRRVTLGIIGRFALGFLSGQLIIGTPFLSLNTLELVLTAPIFGLIGLVVGGIPSGLCATLLTKRLQKWIFSAK